jgi:hypothetical protein
MSTGYMKLLLVWVAKGPRAKECHKWWKAPSVQGWIPIPDDEDEKLQEALDISRREAEFQIMAEEHYKHGGGGGRGGVRGFFRKVTS